MSPHTARRVHEVSFDVTADEAMIIRKIAQRAYTDFAYDVLNTQMDVTATHRNGNPLRLKELLAADKLNFAHDVGGIYRHLARDTGKLLHGFSPRYSVPDARRRRIAS